MSAFTKYSAHTERTTAIVRTTSAALLDVLAPKTQHDGYHVSGDMLAVLAHDTRTRQYRRRLVFARAAAEAEL